jgi:hypothetical protein
MRLTYLILSRKLVGTPELTTSSMYFRRLARAGVAKDGELLWEYGSKLPFQLLGGKSTICSHHISHSRIATCSNGKQHIFFFNETGMRVLESYGKIFLAMNGFPLNHSSASPHVDKTNVTCMGAGKLICV